MQLHTEQRYNSRRNVRGFTDLSDLTINDVPHRGRNTGNDYFVGGTIGPRCGEIRRYSRTFVLSYALFLGVTAGLSAATLAFILLK